jgi:hypothetical protein
MAGALLVASLCQSEGTPNATETSSVATAQSRAEVQVPTTPARDRSSDRALEDELLGLWNRYESRAEGDPVRFWYFHGDGHGLYRYGRIGHTNTHSFNYRVEDGALELRFRKSGDAYHLDFKIVDDCKGARWLSMTGDPREPGASYRHDREPVAAWNTPATAGEGALPGGRMWIDYRNHATGGAGFHMYQLNDAGIDGRGVGWFHRGDFDDWSTESLRYRIHDERLELRFDLNGEAHASEFVVGERREKRIMTLAEDPRDYWNAHTFEDGGKSFGGSHAFDVILGLPD